ncbi:MAG: VOC family protein [Acidobacteria bacterium]|nr:VOC family protein [Acidobacteriota bacterium]
MQAGAKSLEEPVDQSYGDRESGIQDPSGNHWWISTHKLRGPTHYAPEGYHSVTLGLRVAGGLKLIEFLKNAFGAQEIEVTKQKDGTLIIATVRIGDSVVNVSEERGEWKAMPSYVFLYMKDVDAAYKQATGAGAESISEPADQFYGDRTCGVKDAWGNTWWIGTHVEDVSNEEIDRRAQAAGRK